MGGPSRVDGSRSVARVPALAAIALLVATIAGSCAGPGPSQVVVPVEARPTIGAADRALTRFDPIGLLGSIDGGRACRVEDAGGGGESDGRIHRDWAITCPRRGDDRTVYFLLADAIEAELDRIAMVPGKSATLGTVPDPLSTVWDIQGEAYSGTARALGVNGNGTLSIFVSLDLVAP